MPIIAQVGRKALSAKCAISLVYLVLVIGAVTMVYPFLLMLATSVCNEVDYQELRIVPRYLLDDEALFVKYVNTKYGYYLDERGRNIQNLNCCYKSEFPNFRLMGAITTSIWDNQGQRQECLVDTSRSELRQRALDWREFRDGLPEIYHVRCFEEELAGRYHEFLAQRFAGDVGAMNRLYQLESPRFGLAPLPYEAPLRREWEAEETSRYVEWRHFYQGLTTRFRNPVASEKKYIEWLRQRYRTIDALNTAHDVSIERFEDTVFPSSLSLTNKQQADDWELFVRSSWPFRFLRVAGCEAEYRQFLTGHYQADVERMNRKCGTRYRTFDDVPLSETQPPPGEQRTTWNIFVQRVCPAKSLRIDSVETRWRAFVETKYRTVTALNAAHGLALRNFESIPLPYRELDRLEMGEREGEVFRSFVFGNYAKVLDFMALHGRAVFNTFLLCALAILTSLTVNPLCAYALSRFKPAYGYKVLLLLLATMAFPAEVAMIPNFVLLRQLDLLNTFAALVLPGMASGYSIFLLKGFFDSLPREIYEAATIDGAGEMRMFFQITLPLCKPIFAVLGLWAFTGAYGGFMWAFIICQKPDMWTIMVYLYQFQQGSPEYLVMAALTLASLPTLLVFVFCQNIIMRGIVIPVMK
jgi:multiple sugar transport system permease protein